MVPRKRIDIELGDLLAGLRACARARASSPTATQLEARFLALGDDPSAACIACLSVRTAFDLSLQALDVQPGDEVAMSAFTIPHMAAIVRAHGAVPVPIDLDPDTLEPRWDQLERAMGPRTRAVVVAHLFGSRFDAGPGVELARARGVAFIEDAAQAFDRGSWRGHPQADLSLFSFGALKTSTALGGGLAVIRNAALERAMRATEAGYPRRSTLGFARKLGAHVGFKVLARPWVYGGFVGLCRILGIDFDAALNRATRSFRRAPLLEAVRWRPPTSLLELLSRRLEGDRAGVDARGAAGARVAGGLPTGLRHLGASATRASHWLFPVLTDEPDALVDHLRSAGFDATRGGTSLAPVRGNGLRAPAVEAFAARIVYLPVDGARGSSDLDALVRALCAFEDPARPPVEHERGHEW